MHEILDYKPMGSDDEPEWEDIPTRPKLPEKDLQGERKQSPRNTRPESTGSTSPTASKINKEESKPLNGQNNQRLLAKHLAQGSFEAAAARNSDDLVRIIGKTVNVILGEGSWTFHYDWECTARLRSPIHQQKRRRTKTRTQESDEILYIDVKGWDPLHHQAQEETKRLRELCRSIRAARQEQGNTTTLRLYCFVGRTSLEGSKEMETGKELAYAMQEQLTKIGKVLKTESIVWFGTGCGACRTKWKNQAQEIQLLVDKNEWKNPIFYSYDLERTLDARHYTYNGEQWTPDTTKVRLQEVLQFIKKGVPHQPPAFLTPRINKPL